MSFLKRALLAVTRRKSKSIIMFVIFFAIANLVLSGYSIKSATETASVLARQKLGGQLSLTYDRQKAMQRAAATAATSQERPRIQAEPVTEEMANLIKSHTNIIDFNYVVNTNGIADGFEPVVSETQQQDITAQNNQGNFPPNGQRQFGNNFVIPDVTVTGVANTELTDSFNSNGQAKLIDGRHISTEDAGKNVAIVEKNLADQNSLKVGSKIKIKSTGSDNTIEYTIVGIYETGSTDSVTGGGQRMRNMPFTEPYNRIFVDYKSAIVLKTETNDDGTVTNGGIDSAVFFVDDPKNIEKVKADAKNMKIDWDKFILDANDSAYKQMMGPIENVASFSTIAIYIIAAAGAVILTLLLSLTVKERMYETGVLLSMGEGKMKVITQYVAEVLLIAVLSFGLSSFSGKYIAGNISNTLIKKEVTAFQDQSSQGFGQRGQYARLMGQRFQTGQNGNIQPIQSLDINISSAEMGQMMGIGLIIIVLGTIIPALTILRYKPKTILTKAI